MAKPRVFISSTFYDLKYIRSSLENFVERLGYEAILSEKGRIAYDPDIPLDESCYRVAASSDIFVLIIGGRYGSVISEETIETKSTFYDRYESITKKEFESASQHDVPVYILVDRTVMGEYETFCKNRENESIEYAHVESVNIFHLLAFILSKRRNNPLQLFDRPLEIEDWLREQWAGLFRELISRRSEHKQFASLSERVDELSSINTSLQRYLESVVTSVSTSPEAAEELIEKETERQVEEKRLRAFEKTPLIDSLINFHEVAISTALEIYRNSSSIDEICQKTAPLIDFEPNELLQNWTKRKDDIEDMVNIARKSLGLSKLEFLPS